jgi:hypothetical protein
MVSWGPAVRLGWLEVWPVGHLVALLVVWVVVLVLSGTSRPGLVLVGYGLLAGP